MSARIAAALVSVAAGWAVFSYLGALNFRSPPVLEVTAPARPASLRRDAPARRVVWMLIDGLRLDASRGMSTLARLRSQGADVEARAGFPSYSISNDVAQASGLDPEASGVRTNGFAGVPGLDSIFRRAKEAGLRVAAVGTDTPWFTRLYGPWLDDGRILAQPAEPPPDMALVLVHLDYPDAAGHRHGASSPEYEAAVRRADEVLGDFVRHLDPAHGDALVVSSDHGHLARGGHGGAEPEVMAVPLVLFGSGVPRGLRRQGVPAAALGPTLAVLLGLPPLAHAAVAPLFGERPEDGAQRAAVQAALGRVAAGAPSRLARARFVGLPALAVVLGLLGWICSRAQARVRGWVSAPVYLALLAGLYRLTDTVSLSAANEQEPFMLRFVALASVAAIGQMLAGGRGSVGPAALLAGLGAAGAALLVPERPVVDLPGPQALFLPVLAFGALSVIAAWAAFWIRLRR